MRSDQLEETPASSEQIAHLETTTRHGFNGLQSSLRQFLYMTGAATAALFMRIAKDHVID